MRTAKLNSAPGIADKNNEPEDGSSWYWRDACSRSAAFQEVLNMRLQEASIQVAEQRHLIETLQNQVLAPQNTGPQGQLSNNLRYIKKNNDFIYKGNFRNSFARVGVSGTPPHPSLPQSGDNGKVVKEDLNVYAANCRSIVNKRKSVEEIFMIRDIDIGILCELNTKNPPKIKGYQQFKNVSS